MFHLTAFTRRLTAMTFLVVFLNVTVGQCLCAFAGPQPLTLGAAAPAHAGCHGHSDAAAVAPRHHGHHDQASRKAHHQPGKGATGKTNHDCCKDKSASVLAGLSTPSLSKLVPAAPLCLSTPPVLNLSFARFTGWNQAQAVLLVPPQHLPPKIPDIRIYIQSLTV